MRIEESKSNSFATIQSFSGALTCPTKKRTAQLRGEWKKPKHFFLAKCATSEPPPVDLSPFYSLLAPYDVSSGSTMTG